jgi:hypothetical protein
MKTIPKRFTDDPEWYAVEEVINEFITPLLSIRDIDITAKSEDVKAEVIGKLKAYEALEGFITSRGLVRSSKLAENKPNIFR